MSKKKTLHGHNANYDFKQRAPKTPMGSGSFANLPSRPIFKTFSAKQDYRGGIRNNGVKSIDLMSEVEENMRESSGNDSA